MYFIESFLELMREKHFKPKGIKKKSTKRNPKNKKIKKLEKHAVKTTTFNAQLQTKKHIDLTAIKLRLNQLHN